MNNTISRREFLEKSAKTVLSLAAITACGDLFSLKALAKVNIDEVKVGADNLILKVQDLKEREAVNFKYNGKKAILLYNNGEIKAFQNICTHEGGPTKLVGKKLVCQWHGANFDPLTGAALKRPAPVGSHLTSIPLTIKEGKIYISSK